MTLQEQLRARWSALAPREQRALATGGVALLPILVYLLAWAPLARALHAREAALKDSRALAVQLETLAAEAQSRRASSAGAVATGQSLLALVDQTRKASTLTKPPSRLEPEGDTTVRIWMEDVPFDGLVRWLGDLQMRYGVRVDSADIERQSGSGLVNARLTLMK